MRKAPNDPKQIRRKIKGITAIILNGLWYFTDRREKWYDRSFMYREYRVISRRISRRNFVSNRRDETSKG